MTESEKDRGGKSEATAEKASIEIVSARGKQDLGGVRELLLEYGRLRSFDAALGNYEAELADLPGEYAEPDGHLLLAKVDGSSAGCVGLRRIGSEICEMKRMYVRESLRSLGIGRSMAVELLDIATKAGYTKMRLDTHPWMSSAQGLYVAIGFHEIEAYRFNPIAGVRFFERDLGPFRE